MPATSGYQAGTEATNVVLSYGIEAVFGVPPAVAFQQLRLTGESLKGSKTRQRPGEMNTTGEVSAATTTQEMAGGGFNYALSYGTYDDLFASMLRNDWQLPIAVTGAGGDVSISAGAAGTVRTLTSTTAGKFNGLLPGQWFRLGGFTQASANGYFRIITATGTTLTFLIAASTTSETPGGSAAVLRASTLVNSTMVKTIYFQKKLTTALILQYPGSFISGFTLTGGVGQFLSGSFTLMSQVEIPSTTDASTGTPLPAPTGRVHDPVNGWGGLYLNEKQVAAGLQEFTLNVAAKGATQEFAMGSSAAVGIVAGLNEVTGSFSVYFTDYTQYMLYKSEAVSSVAFVTRDPAGNGYVITVQNATLMNPQILAGGPGQPVMAKFELEGNPTIGNGPAGTIRIDRLPAS